MQSKPIAVVLAAAFATLGLALGANPARAEFPAGSSPVLLPMPALPRGPYPGSFDELRPSAQQLAAASVVSRVLLDLAKDPKNQNPAKRGELEQKLRAWVGHRSILLADSSAQYTMQIQQLYVSYFGRPADSSGLASLVQQMDAGLSLTDIAHNFQQSSAAQAFSASPGTSEQVNAIYTNLFGRNAEADGLAYWTAQLGAQGAPPGSFVAETIAAASSTAAEQFNNGLNTGTQSNPANIIVQAPNSQPTGAPSPTIADLLSGLQPPEGANPNPQALTVNAQNLVTLAVTNSAANSPFAGQGGAGSTFTINEVSDQAGFLNEVGTDLFGQAPASTIGGIGPILGSVVQPPVTLSTVSLVIATQSVTTVNNQAVTTQGSINVQDLLLQTGINGSGPPQAVIDINLLPTPLADIAALNAGNMNFTYNGTSATKQQALSFFVSFGVSPFFSGSIQGGTLPPGALGNNFIVNGNLSGNALNATFIGGANVVAAGSTFSGTLTGPSATGITTSYSINVNAASSGTLPVADTGRMTR